MDPDHRLYEARTGLEIAKKHLQAGLTPSTVLFASGAAEMALRIVYSHKTGQNPGSDVAISSIMRTVSSQPCPFPFDIILILEDLAPRCLHPVSLAQLLEEIPIDRASEILIKCEKVVDWADAELHS